MSRPRVRPSRRGASNDETVEVEVGHLRYASDAVDPARLVLGSDGPFPLGEPDPAGFVRRAFGGTGAGAVILHRNAAPMFNLAGQEPGTWQPPPRGGGA